MKHKERMRIIDELTKKLVQKYKDDILLGGVYGSVVSNTDTEYSDIDLLFLVKDNAKAKNFNFRYKNIVVNVHIQKIKNAKEEIKNIDLAWPFQMGGIFYIKVFYGNKKVLDDLRKMTKNIPDSKIKEFLKKFTQIYIYSVFEAFDKLKSLKVRKNYHEKKILVFDILILMISCIAIVNKDFLSGNYYHIIDNIHKFKKLPENFQKLSKKVIQSDNINEVVDLSEELINNFLRFLKDNKAEFKEIKTLEEIKL